MPGMVRFFEFSFFFCLTDRSAADQTPLVTFFFIFLRKQYVFLPWKKSKIISFFYVFSTFFNVKTLMFFLSKKWEKNVTSRVRTAADRSVRQKKRKKFKNRTIPSWSSWCSSAVKQVEKPSEKKNPKNIKIILDSWKKCLLKKYRKS